MTAQSTCMGGSCSTPAASMCQSGACMSTTQCQTCTQSTAPTGITVNPSATYYCPNNQVTLTQTGGSLGYNGQWHWSTNSSFTNSVGSSASISPLTPTATTTYYVRAEGPCNMTSAQSKTLTIRPSTPQVTIAPTRTDAPCNSTDWFSFTATVAASATPIANLQWWLSYDGSDANAFVADSNNRYITGWTTLTVKVAPQSTVYVWCTFTDPCGNNGRSPAAMLFVPTVNSDTGMCN